MAKRKDWKKAFEVRSIQVVNLEKSLNWYKREHEKIRKHMLELEADEHTENRGLKKGKVKAEQRASDLEKRLGVAEKRIEQLLAILVRITRAR